MKQVANTGLFGHDKCEVHHCIGTQNSVSYVVKLIRYFEHPDFREGKYEDSFVDTE
jgi:predicted transport protein